MTLTTKLPKGYRWVAEADGVGHLTRIRGRSIRLCDGRIALEQRAVPVVSYCEACRDQGGRLLP